MRPKFDWKTAILVVFLILTWLLMFWHVTPIYWLFVRGNE